MLEKSPAELTLDELEKLYTEAESCDKRIFAEMRTNLQLVAGEHYAREGSKFWNRSRDNSRQTEDQRLRLVKNHIQRVVKVYQNSIQNACPGVAAAPKDERDMHHQKVAEQHTAVIAHWKTQGFNKKRDQWIANFFQIGEVAVKCFWDQNDGDIVGYESAGTDEMGQPIAGDKPVYSGKMVFETIPGFMLKRDPAIGSIDESPYLIYAKMIAQSVLRTKLTKEEFSKVKEASSFEYTVFDTNTGTYRNTKEQILYKELYFRPCPQAPEGFYYHFTNSAIVSKGPLPYGLFPIVFEACEEQTGNPRGISPIRHLRPCQIEYNRASSKVAEHQITLGDDKVYVQSTTRLSQGAMLPGIRVNSYTGKEPMVVPGRSGEQYFPYLTMQRDELYQIADLEELNQEQDAQVDIYTQLFRSMKFKKKFSVFSDRFERFLTEVTMLGLKLTKKCAHDNAVVPMIGKSEVVNMAEFKSTDELSHQIKVEPRPDDLETQFGRQIQINHIMQYVGNSLQKEDIGKLLRLSPFANKEQSFEDFTLQYDALTNDILALDRGEYRPAKPSADHKYAMERLSTRQSKADYVLLPPQVQQMYDQRLGEHEQLESVRLAKLKEQESQFIPSGGYLVKCDFYSNDPEDPAKTRRVALPSESVAWLMKQLENQGSALDELQNLPGSVLEGISDKLGQAPAQIGPAMPTQQPGPGGEASPGMMHERNGNAGPSAGQPGLGDLLGGYLGGNAGGRNH